MPNQPREDPPSRDTTGSSNPSSKIPPRLQCPSEFNTTCLACSSNHIKGKPKQYKKKIKKLLGRLTEESNGDLQCGGTGGCCHQGSGDCNDPSKTLRPPDRKPRLPTASHLRAKMKTWTPSYHGNPNSNRQGKMSRTETLTRAAVACSWKKFCYPDVVV